MCKILGTMFFFVTCITFAFAQQPGGFRGVQGGAAGGQDPAAMFNRLANGEQFINLATTRFKPAGLEEYARQKGITNGMISLNAYLDYSTNKDKYQPAGGAGAFGGIGGIGGKQGGGKQRPGGAGGAPGGFNTPGAPGGQMAIPGGAPGAAPVPGAPAIDPVELINQRAEFEFRRRDRNGDGQLNYDEMPPQLRDQLERWDLDRNGLISLDEYRQYYAARQQMLDDPTPPPITIIIEDDLDKRPTVYRAGKLPKELPKWFKELDTDKDGQVSFAEWRKSAQDLDEFKDWDRNDDGFITAEEVLSKVRIEAIAKAHADFLEGVEAEEGTQMRGKKNFNRGDNGDSGGNPFGGGKKKSGGFTRDDSADPSASPFGGGKKTKKGRPAD